MYNQFHKYSKRNIYSFVLILLFLYGCVNRFNTNTRLSGNQLVIEGKITNGNGPYTVTVARTSSKERIMEPVGGAHVIIFDDTDHNQELYTEKNTGNYVADGNTVKGHPGHTYHIKVTLKDGSEYLSRPETMPDVVTRDSAYFKIGTQTRINGYGLTVHDNVVRVYVDTFLPQTSKPYYLKWYVSEIYILQQYLPPSPFGPPPQYCFVTGYPNPEGIKLLDGTNANNKEIKDQLMATRLVDYTFFYRHFFNVHVVSMTHNAYIYWKQVSDIVNSNGTIFDLPPATVQGNMYNPANSNEDILGYFEAVSADTARCSTYRTFFSFNIPFPCPASDAHLGCASCLSNPNGTLTEPYYFK